MVAASVVTVSAVASSMVTVVAATCADLTRNVEADVDAPMA